MRTRLSLAPAAALAIVAAACLDYSPHAIPRDDAHTDVHRKSLERLLATPAPEVVRFAVVGDTQGDFDEAQDFVAAANTIDDVAFVVQVGDFTNIGAAPEYTVMNGLFRGLRAPYFVTIGNHDVLGNGGDIYDHVFGERNLAFTYAGLRFVLLDTNAVEYGFDGKTPDLGFLRAALTPRGAYAQAVVFSHMEPGSVEFDPALREPYVALLGEFGVPVTFAGHDHGFRVTERGGTRFFIPGAVDHRSFLLVTVQQG